MKSIWERWPTALGLACAILALIFAAELDTVTTAIGVAALCYLAAAAFNLRWVSWAAIPGGSLVVVASELLDLDRWVGIGIVAVVLVVIGLFIRVPRTPLTAQTLAMLGYGGAAVIALVIEPRAGLVLAGLALAAHGVWDVIHYRRDIVVNRSLAEACIALDIPLGIGAIVLAFV